MLDSRFDIRPLRHADTPLPLLIEAREPGLELQASDAGNVHLVYGEVFNSENIPHIHGSPVRQNDSILSAEAALAAAS